MFAHCVLTPFYILHLPHDQKAGNMIQIIIYIYIYTHTGALVSLEELALLGIIYIYIL